jgi:hypothetical protein
MGYDAFPDPARHYQYWSRSGAFPDYGNNATLSKLWRIISGRLFCGSWHNGIGMASREIAAEIF